MKIDVCSFQIFKGSEGSKFAGIVGNMCGSGTNFYVKYAHCDIFHSYFCVNNFRWLKY